MSNNNCTSINDYDVTSSNIQYLDSSGSVLPDGSEEFGNVRSLDEVGHYKIYYKLFSFYVFVSYSVLDNRSAFVLILGSSINCSSHDILQNLSNVGSLPIDKTM